MIIIFYNTLIIIFLLLYLYVYSLWFIIPWVSRINPLGLLFP